MEIDPQAEELNNVLIASNKSIYDMLCERGKAIFFPKLGILSQSSDAKGKKINATIGIALEEDGSPMRLSCIENFVTVRPQDAFSYAPSYGRQDIREEWKKQIYKKNPSLSEKKITLPVVTNALTHGLSMAAYLFVGEGDEVITPDFYWENYDLIFSNAYAANLKTFPSFKDKSFNIPGLKAALSGEGKKVVILNFPNNPTGYSPSDKEAEEIKNVILKAAEEGAKIVAIIDDAYFGLAFEKYVYEQSLFSKLCDLHENVLAIKIDGATKEDYVWGFRVGFITYGFKGMTDEAAKALEAKTAGAIRGNLSNTSNLSQSILAGAYKDAGYSNQKEDKFLILKKRYEQVKKVLKEKQEYREYFEALPFNSGYFMCIKLKKGVNGEALRQKLLKEYDTGLIVFGDVARIAFSAVQRELIPTLFENIYLACKKLGAKQ